MYEVNLSKTWTLDNLYSHVFSLPEQRNVRKTTCYSDLIEDRHKFSQTFCLLKELLSKFVHLMSKFVHLMSKFVHLMSKFVHLMSKFVHLMSKFVHLMSKFVHLMSKFVHLMGKKIVYSSFFSDYLCIFIISSSVKK